jgi:RNA polymerase sigma-70 factor (ECF subfamily)
MAADPTRARAEADAAGLLYARHYDRVYGYCLYKLGSREEAEDAAQTAFLHAVRALRRGVVPTAEANWLLTIAKNVCLERYRTRGRRRRLEVLSEPQALASVAATAEEAGDSRLRLEEALTRIPEQQRRAILLREWRGLSYREVAEELGISVAAVETLIFRARRSLAEILDDERPRSRRGLTGVFDLGGLSAAVKALLAGASAAKVAAGLTALTAALVAWPSLAPPGEPEPPVAPPEAAAPALAAPDRPVVRPLAERDSDGRTRTPRSGASGGSTSGGSRPKSAPTNEPAERAAPAAPVVQAATGAVEETVEATTETVTGAVETVSGTVDGLVEETGLPLPEVGGVTGDLDEGVDGVVDGLVPLLP